MFTHLFQRKGDGTLTCPRCGGVIGTGQYIVLIRSIPYHNYCGQQERKEEQLKEEIHLENVRLMAGFQ